MKITNINGTSDTNCKCGSWLNHWINYSRQNLPTYCPVLGCSEKPELGDHVQKANSYDRKWYIIPLCKTHNRASGILEISDTINLVSANKNETCG